MRENDKGGKEDEKGSKSAADIWAITSNQEKWTQVRCKVKGSWGPNRIEALKKKNRKQGQEQRWTRLSEMRRDEKKLNEVKLGWPGARRKVSLTGRALAEQTRALR